MFKDNFPTFYKLIGVLAEVVKDAEHAIKESGIVAKAIDFEPMIPELLVFLPMVGGLSAEIKKMGPSDYAAAAEELVAELGIVNGSAQAIIRAAFPIVDDLAALEPKVVALISAIHGAKEA